jgi:energy-converting hydrogenase Eha subunit C
MGLRQVFGIVFASLGFASLLLSILLFIYAIYVITKTPSLLAGLAFLPSVLLWPVSTVLYVVGYLISIGMKSRLLAVLFTVGGAINLFIGSALTVFLLAQHGFDITSVSVRESLPFLSIIILVGIAFILAGRRKL